MAIAFVALILSSITVSLSALMAGELRHAIDNESSIKSYYEAEGAAEEATRHVKDFLATNPGDPPRPLKDLNQGCSADPATQFVPHFVTANITCVRITAVGSPPQETPGPEQAVEYDLSGLNFDRVEVFWSPSGSSVGAPPTLEASLINYGRDPAESDHTSIGSVLLDPGLSSCSAPCAPFHLFYSTPGGPEPTAAQLKTGVERSNPSYTFNRSIDHSAPVPGITGPVNTVLRIRTHESAVKFQIKIWKGGTVINAVPLPNAQIDVTAKVGNTTRRLVMQEPLKDQTLPFNVLYADQAACKDFDYLTSPGGDSVEQNICPIGNAPTP